MEARALIAQARSQYWPTSQRQSVPGLGSKTSGNAERAIRPRPTSGRTSTILSLPVDVSWVPDFWGKIRNEVREYQYAAQVSAADLETERLTEQASLAQYYFEIRGQDALQEDL